MMDAKRSMDGADEQLRAIARAGGARIVVKEGWFWETLHWIVFVVTFGTNRDFLEHYYTTIGNVIGVPRGWESSDLKRRTAVIEHELVHVEQCRRLGFGNVWLGFPLFAFLYVLFPLPVGFAYFRWRFEREAYAHGIRVYLTLSPVYLRRDLLRGEAIDNAVDQLTSGSYAWTWLFRSQVRRYFEKNIPA